MGEFAKVEWDWMCVLVSDGKLGGEYYRHALDSRATTSIMCLAVTLGESIV